MDTKEIVEFSKNKKVQWATTIILLLVILAVGANIRLQPITTGHLIDKTTGNYTPLALDPYYFLRVSETLIADNWTLPKVDNMHYQALKTGWTPEILPKATIALWHIIKVFDSKATLNFADVLGPTVFFTLGIIVFFFLALLLSKSKSVALASIAILSVIPPYLYRTLAGFSDHDSLGMLGVFLSLTAFFYGMRYLSRKNPKHYISSIMGLVAGFFTMFTIASWGGGAKFLFMILPLAFIITWFIEKREDNLSPVLFYSSWIAGILIFTPILGFGLRAVLRGFMLSPTGMLSVAVLGYIIIYYLLARYNLLKGKLSKYSEIISAGIALVLGLILYGVFIGDVFTLITNLLGRVINPFGTGRVGLTVAENKQPYLSDWIGQISKTFFYIFLAGCLFVGAKISDGIKKKKFQPLFLVTFTLFILGILFSRISSGSILNGENFISKALFLISFLIFATSTFYIYLKSEWNVEARWIFIVAWMIPMLLSVRSAVRIFFVIVPFVSFIIPLILLELYLFARKSKDSITKTISWTILVLLIALVVINSYGFYNSVSYQAKVQTPAYNTNWQNAMSWVRNNTAPGSVFLQWWDYGYWIQTGGDRPTVTDGGHYNAYWDNLVGRYVLTTPYPATAKSFMKAHNVSYLLIDPSDIGKYAAYSSIANSAKVDDRASYLPTFISKQSEIHELRNGTRRIYKGGFMLDSDLIYKNSSKQIFLPKGKAGLGAIIIETENHVIKQPTGIFVYNGKQYSLPLRYVFIDGKLHDFGSGINSVAYIYPSVETTNGRQGLDKTGAVMYLSNKTMNSLVAQLYLMGDPNHEYPELKVVDKESAYPFMFYYPGISNPFQGPLTIWYVNKTAMTNIIARNEFNARSGVYGGLDNLKFTK